MAAASSSIERIVALLTKAETFTQSGFLEDANAIYNELLAIPFLGETLTFRAKLSRAKNFFGVAQKMKGIASSTSDKYPRSGLDLLTWCEMSINESNELIRLFPSLLQQRDSNNNESNNNYKKLLEEVHLLKIEASIFASQPVETTRRYVLSALAEFPESKTLQAFLNQTQPINIHHHRNETTSKKQDFSSSSGAVSPRQFNPSDLNLECTICHDLFYDPVTLACGHTFDRQCLIVTLDHSAQKNENGFGVDRNNGGGGGMIQRCPLCRIPLHVDMSSFPSNLVLSHVIQTLFPERYNERGRETANREKNPSATDETTYIEQKKNYWVIHTALTSKPKQYHLPVMVSFSKSPGHAVGLRIFEPRYRLMIRRCLAGSREFVLVEPRANNNNNNNDADINNANSMAMFHPVGIIVKIKDSTIKSDGQIMVSGWADRRVRVLDCSDLDGYRLGVCEDYDDDDPSNEEQAAVIATACRNWAFHVMRHLEQRNERFVAPPFCRELVEKAPVRSVAEARKILKEMMIAVADKRKEENDNNAKKENENDDETENENNDESCGELVIDERCLLSSYFKDDTEGEEKEWSKYKIVDPIWAKENFHKIVVPVSLYCGEFYFSSNSSWQNNLISKTITRLEMCRALKFVTNEENDTNSSYTSVRGIGGAIVGQLKNVGTGAASIFKNSKFGKALGF